MVKYFSLIILVGFFAVSTVKADVCDFDWWKTATADSLETLIANGETFPEFCNTWQDTPLHLGASVSQDAHVISTFIDVAKADVLAVNIYEETPLGLAQRRLNTANTLAQYARETYLDSRRLSTESRTSGSLRHLRNRLIRASLAAREKMNQALDEQQIAEAIYQTLSLKSQ